MKKRLVSIIGIAFLLGGLACMSALQAGEIASAQFLKLGAGARAASMADAFTSVADDVTAGYWNPAGLSQVKSPELAMMQNNWLVNTQYQYLGGALPMKNHTLALSIYRVDYGSIDRYTAADTRDGSFQAGSLAGSLSLSSPITETLSWGFSAKYLQETIDSKAATGMALDVGALYRSELFNIGASVQNLGTKMQFIETKESLPRIARVGVSHKFFQDKFTVACDLSKPSDNDRTIHTGFEMTNSILSIRGGYQTTPGNSPNVSGLTNLTAGLGFNFHRISFDYAFIPYGDLGNTHRFSLLFHFSPSR